MKGYWNKILRVDLTKRKVLIEKLNDKTCKEFIGGTGLATKIIFSEVDPSVDAFNPDNRLVFAVGPFNGVNIPGSGRWTVASRSPLTGIWGEASGGGYWGTEFKRTGYDALVIQGRSDKPVYLWIKEDMVELRSASHLWGMDTYETDNAVKKELGDRRVSVVCIGPAGEKLVKIASIISDQGHGVAARTGLGAVMGSKNLKAIAVKGTKNIEIAEENKLDELVESIRSKIVVNANILREHGTPNYVISAHDLGDLPIKYWAKGEWRDSVTKIGTPTYTQKLSAKARACSFCPIGCHRYVEIKSEKFESKGMGPEYETLAMFGSLCLVDDLSSIVKANELCNRYGIDTISTGAIIGFLMECYEKGLITKDHTDGIEFTWGNSEALIQVISKIAKREGFGDILAEGEKNVAKKFGVPNMMIQVKGLAVPAHDPRAFFSMAINYATSNRGACHMRGNPYIHELGVTIPEVGITNKLDRFSWRSKGYITARSQDICILFDSLVQCKFMVFGGLTITDQVNLLRAVTGWNLSITDFLKTGERIFNLQRVYNIRLGISRKDDDLPKIIFEKIEREDRNRKIPPLKLMLSEYYRVRGWDSDGKPTREKMHSLGLLEEFEIAQQEKPQKKEIIQ